MSGSSGAISRARTRSSSNASPSKSIWDGLAVQKRLHFIVRAPSGAMKYSSGSPWSRFSRAWAFLAPCGKALRSQSLTALAEELLAACHAF
eukprot:6941044-Pyramimonas_sp.AAC.1